MILKDSGNEDLTQNSLEKTIDENSKDLMFKVLQSHQYRYPVKSAIRETASNGVDSHNERNMAIAILTNKAKVSDYYDIENNETGMQHSSKFDPSYYDLNWLSDKSQIRITYIERSEENRDLIRFEDWGVGLGGSRLEGYFALAYSTKRGNKKLIGGWGLGAKAFLATDIDSFRVTSFYNGKKFVFDVYETTVNSVTPKFGDNGKNDIFTFPRSGYQCYYEKTTRKNGVIVEATVVKSQKYDYHRAVKTQLLYMDKVDFWIHSSWGGHQQEDFHADILYKDDNILISSNSIQSKPHILMGDPELGTLINYGFVDFEALEMSQYYGSVGIIVSPNEVDISTSRENLLWKKKTRLGIQRKFDLVKNTAEAYVKKKISIAENNLFEWLEASHSIISASKNNSSNNSSKDNVLAQLSKVIDIDEITFKKTGDLTENFVYLPITKYFKSKDNLVVSRYITQANVEYNYRDNVGTVKRTGIANWNILFNNSVIYLVTKGEKIQGAAIRYLKKNNENVVFINENGYEYNSKLKKFVEEGLKINRINLYSELKIPDEELDKFNKIEEAIGLTLQEKRRIEGKVVLKKILSGGYIENKEYTKEDIALLNGIYGEHNYIDTLRDLSTIIDSPVYVASESTIRIIEETNSSLNYFKDSLYSIKENKIKFLSQFINDYIMYRISESTGEAKFILSSNDIVISKHRNFTNILSLLDISKEIKIINNNISHKVNSYVSFPYSNAEYFKQFKRFIDVAIDASKEGKLINSKLDDYNFNFNGIEKVRVFDEFENDFENSIISNKLSKIINKNAIYTLAYIKGLITLEKLNSSIKIKF